MMINLNKLLIIIVLFISTSSFSKQEVLFTINNKPTTSIDLKQRLNYLKLLNQFNDSVLQEDYIYNDLISIKLFDEFAEKRNFNVNENEIVIIFNNIINRLDKNNLNLFNKLKQNNEITNDIILENIRLDIQRQKILEIFVKEKVDRFILTKNSYNIIDIFNVKFNYFIVPNIYSKQINEIDNELLINEVSIIKELLDKKNIEYNFFSKDLINLNQLDGQIKENIFKGNNIFLIDKNDYIIIGYILKNLKKDIGIRYSFFQIFTKNNINFDELNNESINCDNIEEIKSNNQLEIIEYDSIQLEKLNLNVFQNLSKENDKLIIKNNEQKLLILLCKIEYNTQLVEKKLYEKNINKLANQLEIEFIKTRKKDFNFKLIDN